MQQRPAVSEQPRRFRNTTTRLNVRVLAHTYSGISHKIVSFLRNSVAYVERHTGAERPLSWRATLRIEGLSNIALGCGAISDHNLTEYLSDCFSNNEACLYARPSSFGCYFHGHLGFCGPTCASTLNVLCLWSQSPRELFTEPGWWTRNVEKPEPNRAASHITIQQLAVSLLSPQ